MPRVWIKICANTNLVDARLAADLGADAVGFVFAASPRQVSVDQAARIVRELPSDVEKIGVFSSRDDQVIVDSVRAAGLTGVQLHGGIDMPLVRRLSAEFGDTVHIIQTVHWELEKQGSSANEIATQLDALAAEPALHRVLIDSKTMKASGGTGLSFNWDQAVHAVTDAGGPRHTRLIVAGGLRPENVEVAIAALEPWGVDVASGVEDSPGRKDARKMELFISAVRFRERKSWPGPAKESDDAT